MVQTSLLTQYVAKSQRTWNAGRWSSQGKTVQVLEIQNQGVNRPVIEIPSKHCRREVGRSRLNSFVKVVIIVHWWVKLCLVNNQHSIFLKNALVNGIVWRPPTCIQQSCHRTSHFVILSEDLSEFPLASCVSQTQPKSPTRNRFRNLSSTSVCVHILQMKIAFLEIINDSQMALTTNCEYYIIKCSFSRCKSGAVMVKVVP